MIKVLFVCMGNICRSPTAHGVFEMLVKNAQLSHAIAVDSAGTHAYHIGEAPDKRSQVVALQQGFNLSHLKARRVEIQDFAEFDYILAMDTQNLAHLQRYAPPSYKANIQLLMQYASRWKEEEVPDPYYGGSLGFARVLDMVEDAADGLLNHIRRIHHL